MHTETEQTRKGSGVAVAVSAIVFAGSLYAFLVGINNYDSPSVWPILAIIFGGMVVIISGGYFLPKKFKEWLANRGSKTAQAAKEAEEQEDNLSD
jgi:hypothetical protein